MRALVLLALAVLVVALAYVGLVVSAWLWWGRR